MRKTMVAHRSLICGMLLVGSVVFGQDAGNAPADDGGNGPTPVVINPPRPRTRLEEFVARKGTLLVKGFTEIGTVQGEEGSAMKITAVEITDSGKQDKAYGLVLAIRSRAGREATAWVDYDELGPFLSAVDALRNIDATAATKMQNYEATYRTRGDVELTNYDLNGGRFVAVHAVQVAPLSGQLNWATAHFRLATTAEIHQQVVAAKDLIDKARGGQ
jgi:hypothetical protein